MSQNASRFGILTLATPNDYLKAIGLALSVRVSNPGVPIAVACSARVRPLLEPYFDLVVEEQAGLRGFVHKVYLDKYSPFEETMFFDSDVFVFTSVKPYVDDWRKHAYTATGKMLSTGKSTFGMDRVEMLRQLGKPSLVVIDGAGHAFFRKPDCYEIFETARDVTARHREIMGPIPYADEDIMDYVMTKYDLPPMPMPDFFSRYRSAVPGTVKLDPGRGLCEFVFQDTGKVMNPCMMHFAANEAPVIYHLALHKLFRQFDVKLPGIWSSALKDSWELYVRLPVHKFKKRHLGK